MPSAVKKKRQLKAPPTVVENFSLVGLRLCRSHSLLQLDGGEVPTKIKIQVNVGYSINAEEKVVVFLCECHVTTEHEPEKLPAVSIAVAYETFYHAKTDAAMTSVDQLLPFLSLSAQFHVWPYIRRHIHQASIDMAVNPILLPLFSPTPVRDAGQGKSGAALKSEAKRK